MSDFELAEDLVKIEGADAPPGWCYQCPDCATWMRMGRGAATHARVAGHGVPFVRRTPKVAGIGAAPPDSIPDLKAKIEAGWAALGVKIAELEERAEVRASRARDSSAFQDDLFKIIKALGLGDHARPASCREIVEREVLPAIAGLTDERKKLGGVCEDWNIKIGYCMEHERFYDRREGCQKDRRTWSRQTSTCGRW
jgi:hypothetical protein